MYPFEFFDYDFNVQPKVNIAEYTHLKLTPGFEPMNEYVTDRHIASIDVFRRDEGWVPYEVNMEYEDSHLGRIISARWYHTEGGPYIILEYEYGKRWFGSDCTTSDVSGELPESGYYYKAPVSSNSNEEKSSERQDTPARQHTEESKRKTIVIEPFALYGDIDFRLSPIVKITSGSFLSYNVYVLKKNGEEQKKEWECSSGFEFNLGTFRFAKWENIQQHYFINLAFTKGTIRLGSNGNYQELPDIIKDNRRLEHFSPNIYDMSAPPAFAIFEENNEQWYEVKALSKQKNKLISICKRKIQDEPLKSVYWYEFDDGDMFIVLNFQSGNKWLGHNGLTVNVDPPADKRNIRQNKWSAGTDIEAMSIFYDEETEPVIIKDNTGNKIKVTSFSEDELLDISDINEDEFVSASWHEYDEGLFLLLISPHKIYLIGGDPEVEDGLKLKYKIIRNS